MRNPNRKMYHLPLQAVWGGMVVGAIMAGLILFLSNDTLGLGGTVLLLGWLLFFYVMLFSLLSLGGACLWRLIWDWPRGEWLVPLFLIAVSVIYTWNFYLYRLFLRPIQKLVLIFEVVLFLIFSFWTWWGKNDQGGEISKNSGRYLLFLCFLIIVVNGSLTSVTNRVPRVQTIDFKAAPNTPLYVFGLDGADWKIMWPYHKMGKIAVLSRLIRNGSRHQLETYDPTSSPLIWTTIVTGKDPFQHGIRDFGLYRLHPTAQYISVLPKGAGFSKIAALAKKLGLWEFYPSSSLQNRCPPIWDIASEQGLSVTVNNWPVSIPVSAVKGIISGETGYYSFHNLKPEGRFFPELIENELNESKTQLVVTPPDKTLTLDDDVRLALQIEDHMVGQWSSYRYGLKKWPALLTMVYTHSLDLFQHLFWRFGYRESHNISPEKIALASRMIENHIIRLDQQLGPFYESLPFQPYTLILSDHGFRTIYFFEKWTHPQSERVQGVHDFSPAGFFLAHGPGIRRNQAGPVFSIFDIMPTLLHLLGLPTAQDMRGSSLVTVLLDNETPNPERPPPINTYQVRQKQQSWPRNKDEDSHIETKLKSLGYIE
ncbi:alkaline phosphatase family protein [candidate division CSSED10-310 bacterium]|uniref:Alkaline phosphatase family protein n=1 Tax=candidate division CSSED10-310 bacterium TaxID=2855610 RepID=A0ABV6Z5G6_UNCC1